MCDSVCWRPWKVNSVLLKLLEMPGLMRCVLFCIREAVEGGLFLLDVPKVMRCVLLYMLETVEGGLCYGDVGGDAPCALLYAGGSL